MRGNVLRTFLKTSTASTRLGGGLNAPFALQKRCKIEDPAKIFRELQEELGRKAENAAKRAEGAKDRFGAAREKSKETFETFNSKIEDTGIKDKAGHVTQQVSERTSGVRSKLGGWFSSVSKKTRVVTSKTKDGFTSVKTSVSSTTTRLSSAAGEKISDVGSASAERLSDAAKKGSQKVGETYRAAKEQMKTSQANAEGTEHVPSEGTSSSTGPSAQMHSSDAPDSSMAGHTTNYSRVAGRRAPPKHMLVLFQRELEWWEKPFYDLSDRFENTESYEKMQTLKAKLKRTDQYKRVEQKVELLNERVQSLWQTYDETQNPTVVAFRDAADALMCETEHGATVRKIRSILPSFWPEDFEEEIQEHIPAIVEAFLGGKPHDIAYLEEFFIEDAAAMLSAYMQARKNLDRYPDERILWVNPCGLNDANLDMKIPQVTLSTVVQQVDIERNAKGEIMEGHEDKVANVAYMFTMTPEPDLEHITGFPWQVMKFQCQKMQTLGWGGGVSG